MLLPLAFEGGRGRSVRCCVNCRGDSRRLGKRTEEKGATAGGKFVHLLGAERAHCVEAEDDAVFGAGLWKKDGEGGLPVVLVGGIDQHLGDGEFARGVVVAPMGVLHRAAFGGEAEAFTNLEIGTKGGF